jgi:hypothetical protein
MKMKKLITLVLTVIFFIAVLASCNQQVCPAYAKASDNQEQNNS